MFRVFRLDPPICIGMGSDGFRREEIILDIIAGPLAGEPSAAELDSRKALSMRMAEQSVTVTDFDGLDMYTAVRAGYRMAEDRARAWFVQQAELAQCGRGYEIGSDGIPKPSSFK